MRTTVEQIAEMVKVDIEDLLSSEWERFPLLDHEEDLIELYRNAIKTCIYLRKQITGPCGELKREEERDG